MINTLLAILIYTLYLEPKHWIRVILTLKTNPDTEYRRRKQHP